MQKKEILENSVQILRKRKKVTQEQLAEEVGVTRQTIISIEKGNYVPSVLLAMKIARYFNVKIEDLFTIKK